MSHRSKKEKEVKNILDPEIYRKEELFLLRSLRSKRRKRGDAPVLIFLCGGDENEHPARGIVKDCISGNTTSETSPFHNVYCVIAENMAPMEEFRSKNLIIQEAMIADASDCIVLFAESVGSFCELGIFSTLPSISSIFTVCHDREHAMSNGFLQGGPIRMVEERPSSLAKTFAVNLKSPLDTLDFSMFLCNIKDTVKQDVFFKRKKISSNPSEIAVGGYVHELLDIIHYFSPIRPFEVELLFKEIKDFNGNELLIYSPTLRDSIKIKGSAEHISTEQVLAFMIASGLIKKVSDSNNEDWLIPVINPESSFLFANENDILFRRIVARILVRKRHRKIGVMKSVYRRYDN